MQSLQMKVIKEKETRIRNSSIIGKEGEMVIIS